jgi:hypothetical protein
MSPGTRPPPRQIKAAHDAWESTDPPKGDGWQLWETVSEGSPITPVFATAEGLIDHLTTVGTSWSKGEPMRREAAEALVRDGWCPSMVAVGGVVYANEEALVALDAAKEG